MVLFFFICHEETTKRRLACQWTAFVRGYRSARPAPSRRIISRPVLVSESFKWVGGVCFDCRANLLNALQARVRCMPRVPMRLNAAQSSLREIVVMGVEPLTIRLVPLQPNRIDRAERDQFALRTGQAHFGREASPKARPESAHTESMGTHLVRRPRAVSRNDRHAHHVDVGRHGDWRRRFGTKQIRADLLTCGRQQFRSWKAEVR